MKRTNLSFRLAKAVASGRGPGALASREAILAALLSKRAAARQAGLADQEALLREQILWSLPVRHPDDGREDPEAAPSA